MERTILNDGKQIKGAGKKRQYSLFVSRYFFAFAIFQWCLIFTFPLAAQTIISGTVRDKNNAPVANAQVSLTAQNKIISQTKTGANGEFSVDLQNTQNSILLVEAQGFSSFTKTLPKGFRETLQIVLEPQSVREDVIVSITRTGSRLSETPASIVVLDRQILNQTAAQTIDDALRQVAGFTLFRRSSGRTTNPTTQGANLRGIGGSGTARTAVLLDGVSLNDTFGGWTFWSRVPKIAVEEVEILRGGASSIYGNAALSGAINLQTIQPETPVLRFETSAGTQKTFDGSLFTAYGKKGWNFDFAAESFQTAGYIPSAAAERGTIDTKANSRHQNGFLTVARKFRQNGRIFGRINLFAERRDNGTSLTNNRTYFRQAVFGANFNGNKSGTFQFRASIESQIYDQTFSAISNNRHTETLSRIQRVPSQSANADLFWSKFLKNHVVSGFAELRRVHGFSDETVFSNNRATSLIGAGGKEQILGFFTQDFWRVNGKLNINFGARFDDWNEFNALSTTKNLAANQTAVSIFPNRRERAFSPKIGAVYQLTEHLSILGSYARSFRAPTLNELYRAFRVGNVLTLANENLQAERAATFETGANFTTLTNRLNIRGNVFSTEVTNPVVSITLSATPNLITRERQNVGKTRSNGLELEAEFAPFAKLKFSAGYLLVDSRLRKFPADLNLIGKFLPQIPRQQLTFQAFYRPHPKFSFSLQGRISAAQFEDDLNTLRLRSFFTLDAFAAYRLSQKLEIFTAVENVFNNRYDIGLTPNRTVAAPRFVRLGLRY